MLKRFGNSRNILFSGFVLALAACATQAPVKPDHLGRGDYSYAIDYIRWYVPQLLDEHDTPGVSLALVDGQKLVWAQGFGMADVENKVPAAADTVYRIASISKTFTATAAMQLQDRGRMRADNPLKQYLPEFSIRSRYQNTPPITPRMIMTHHSGLPADIMKGMWNSDGEARFTDVVTQFRDQYAAYPPDYIYSYSNAAVSLLGHAVQKVSGQPFYEYVEQNISQPLGMMHTSHELHPHMKARLAGSYSDGDYIDAGQLRDTPAGGMYSSVNDLSHFMRMILAGGEYNGKRILKPETIREMMRPQNANVPLDFGLHLGMGWFLVDHGIKGVKTVASHGGGAPCYFSQMIVLPEQQLGVVALANSCTSGPVVAESATRLLKLALEAKTGIRQQLEEKVEKAALAENPSEQLLDSFVGKFATWLGLIDVKRNGKQLQASLSGWKFDLLPHTDGKFSIRFKLFGLISIRHLYGIDLDNVLLAPARVDDKTAVVMTFKGREQLLGALVKPQPIPEAWLARLGEMEITNQDAYMQFRGNRLEVKDGILVMSYKLKMTVLPEQSAMVPIMPISDDEAVVMGLGRNMNETIRIVRQGKREVMHYSGYLSRWLSYDNGHGPFAPTRLATEASAIN
ncbi:MAG: beta-lactamase family protein [Gammaproteobacteria bacterium]|nr:beta-lactamase family protein [Gammaproteobacteria bacterium]